MNRRLDIFKSGMETATGKFGQYATIDGHNYVFHLKHTSEAETTTYRWRCRNYRTCKSALMADSDGNILKEPTAHTHDPPGQIGALGIKARSNIRTKAKNDATKTAGQIISDVRNPLPSVITDGLPGTHALKNMINRIRTKVFEGAVNPETLAELIDIPDDYKYIPTRDSVGMETGRELFLSADIGEGDDRVLIFGRKKAFRMLGRAERWFVDGTFKVPPKLFAQLFTIHAPYEDTHRTVPLVYCLLPNKNEDTYEAVFTKVSRLANGAPLHVHSDFESSILNAAKVAFPAVQLHGCNFHLFQSWRRKLEKLGMSKTVDNDLRKQLDWKYLKSLSYVPTDEVVATYEDLLRSPEFDLNFWEPFLDYLEKWYIGVVDRGGQRGDGQFPRALWNVYEAALGELMKTTNSVEGYHHALNLFFSVAHPTIWRFIGKLKEYEAGVWKEVRAWDLGHIPPRNRTWQVVQRRKREAVLKWAQVMDQTSTRRNYLSIVAATLS